MSLRSRPTSTSRQLSWTAIRASHVRAERRLAALRRACALGGVSLAVLAGAASANAQDATRKPGANPSAQTIGVPGTPSTAQSLVATFGAPTTNPFGYVAPSGTNAPTTYIVAAFGDLDSDGDEDMLAGGNTGIFTYYQNTAGAGVAPTFAAPVNSPFGLIDVGGFTSPSLADLDGDGDLDIAVGLQTGATSTIFNTGTATAPAFGAATSLGISGTFNGTTAADFDGDGDIDVLSGNNAGNFIYRQNTAGRGNAPVFAAAVTNPFGLVGTGAASYNQPTAADFDRDGDLDILAQTASGNFSYFQNTAGPGAAPVFAAAVTNPFGLIDTGASGVQPGIADLDGDGDLDVMSSAGNGTNALQYFQNTESAGPLTATLTGTEGWRMLASPVSAVTLQTLLAPIATQGIPGADNPAGAPNVYSYVESLTGTLNTGYATPAALSNFAGAGVGYFVYVYTDDDPNTPGTQGTFPKTLSVTGASAPSPFSFATLTYTNTGAPADDGWNLLGNPFSRWFDWDASARTGLDASVYVYNPTTASYLVWNGTAGSLAGGIVAPFQGFWVKANAAAPTLRASAPTAASGGPFYGREAGTETVVGLELRRADGSAMRSEAFVTVGQADAAAGRDALDAVAMLSPDADYVLLSSEATSAAGPVQLAIDARPEGSGTVEIPLQVDARTAGVAAGGDLVIAWPTLDNLPAEWTVQLRDNVDGAVVDLRTTPEYAFSMPASRTAAPARDPLALGAPLARATGPARFTLVLGRGAVAAEPGVAGAAALSAPRPNPTAGGAALALDLATPAPVSVGVFDALGRRVAVLADGPLGAGAHSLRLADGVLAAGVYVVRAEVRGEDAAAVVLTQRLVVTR